ncbi:MAG TPA: hypothetical protein PLR38_00515 [Syntrophorhabdaceae bacterium]|nr:hypothetical protein [Syntrophorhabdaceae bacterium]
MANASKLKKREIFIKSKCLFKKKNNMEIKTKRYINRKYLKRRILWPSSPTQKIKYSGPNKKIKNMKIEKTVADLCLSLIVLFNKTNEINVTDTKEAIGFKITATGYS